MADGQGSNDSGAIRGMRRGIRLRVCLYGSAGAVAFRVAALDPELGFQLQRMLRRGIVKRKLVAGAPSENAQRHGQQQACPQAETG